MKIHGQQHEKHVNFLLYFNNLDVFLWKSYNVYEHLS